MISQDKLLEIVNLFDSFYMQHASIEDLIREQKLQSLQNVNRLFPVEDDFFSNYTINPMDMEFEFHQVPSSYWDNLITHVTSAIPIVGNGRSIKFIIKEKTTNKIVGFIRLGSPVINCKPRNNLLDGPFTRNPEISSRFNSSTTMGFTIVPVQPFGYNYLGGKLLTAISCSHEIRKLHDEKYNSTLCLFETTSLYGSSKTVSQYDGMKNYIKFKGLTDSNFVPLMHEKEYKKLVDIVDSIDPTIILRVGSSKKLKSTLKVISLVKTNLQDKNVKERFLKIVNYANSLTEQKRYYISTYGFKNSLEYIKGESDTLIESDSFDNFYLHNIFSWWKKKAQNRFESLKRENRLKTEMEVWGTTKHIDIIR